LNKNELDNFSNNFKDLFLLFCQKISQLTFLKIKELSFSQLDDDNETDFTELEENINEINEKDNV